MSDYYCPNCRKKIQNMKETRIHAKTQLCMVAGFILAGIMVFSIVYLLPIYFKESIITVLFSITLIFSPIFILLGMYLFDKIKERKTQNRVLIIGLIFAAIIFAGLLAYIIFILQIEWIFTIWIIIAFLLYWGFFTLLTERIYYGTLEM